MNLSELGAGVFVLYPKEIELFIVNSRDNEVCLEIFEILNWVPKDIINRMLYVHLLNKGISINKVRNFEFGLLPERKLIEVYKEKNWLTPKERDTMFNDYKIIDVKFSELNDVALENAIEKKKDQLTGVEIRTKGDKTYLIVSGTAIELKGTEFIELVEKSIKGKTVSAVSKNTLMKNLIEELGLIKEITLTKKTVDISSLFE